LHFFFPTAFFVVLRSIGMYGRAFAIVNVQHRPAGITEQILDTFVSQTPHNDFGTGQFHDEDSSGYKEKTP